MEETLNFFNLKLGTNVIKSSKVTITLEVNYDVNDKSFILEGINSDGVIASCYYVNDYGMIQNVLNELEYTREEKAKKLKAKAFPFTHNYILTKKLVNPIGSCIEERIFTYLGKRAYSFVTEVEALKFFTQNETTLRNFNIYKLGE